ncbi:hypothetical protein [Streptomyces lunalinharesii]|uniref:Uncharacterized protein n=1 Tax=Streptomyces lunalinharesii TaxID=333384 RepID=A0ABN3SWH7_9ACTN
MTNLPLPSRTDGDSIAAEMARTAHELRASGHDDETVQQTLIADELTIDMHLRPAQPE